MDPKTLEQIVDLSRKSNAVQVVTLPGENERVLLIYPNGEREFETLEPPARKHVVKGIESIVAMAENQSSVWVDRTGVVILHDDYDRFGRSSMPLTFTPQLLRIQQLEKSPGPFKQSDLVLELRTMFRNCLQHAGDIVNVLRSLKFRVNASGNSEVGHGKASIGRSLEAEITGSKALPEYVTFAVQVWNELPAHVVKIEVAFEPDAATETLRFIPIPGQVEQQIISCVGGLQRSLTEDLKSITKKVYIGVPC